jgi:hypothetical protein
MRTTATGSTPGTRARWAAIGAAVAVAIGGGGLGIARATVTSGDKPVFVSIEPRRILDTRSAVGLTGKFVDATPRDLQVTGDVAVAGVGTAVVVPPGATGVALNVTVVDADGAGFISVRPGGAAGEPLTSNLNFEAGQVVPNAVNVDLPASGQIQLWLETYEPGRSGDVLVDVVGYYDDHTHDDRYYTKGEVDAAKFISLNVYANPDINFTEDVYGDLNDAGVGGLNVDVNYNFTVPPDYTAGTPLTVRVLAYSRTATTCNGDIEVNSVYATRVGVGKVDATLSPAAINAVFTAADIPQEYAFTLNPGVAGLQSGDAVSFGLFAFAPMPRCDLVITGAAVYYD